MEKLNKMKWKKIGNRREMQKQYKGERRGKIGLHSNVKAKLPLFFCKFALPTMALSNLVPRVFSYLAHGSRVGEGTRLGFVE